MWGLGYVILGRMSMVNETWFMPNYCIASRCTVKAGDLWGLPAQVKQPLIYIWSGFHAELLELPFIKNARVLPLSDPQIPHLGNEASEWTVRKDPLVNDHCASQSPSSPRDEKDKTKLPKDARWGCCPRRYWRGWKASPKKVNSLSLGWWVSP